MDSGVYGILCEANGRIYIGSTNNFKRRKKEHFNLLRNNKHGNEDLQNDFIKLGESYFKFLHLWFCDEDKLTEAEKHFLSDKSISLYNKILDPTNHKGKNNPCYGRKLTEEQKKALQDGWKGQPSPKRKITIEQCYSIKEDLIKMHKKLLLKEQFKILSETYNTTEKQIDKIRKGDHWSSKELGGSIWDWLNIPKNERRKK